MSSFTEKARKLYEEKKKLSNPPKYFKTLEELLKLEDEVGESINQGS